MDEYPISIYIDYTYMADTREEAYKKAENLAQLLKPHIPELAAVWIHDCDTGGEYELY
jgi:hypothetical protein